MNSKIELITSLKEEKIELISLWNSEVKNDEFIDFKKYIINEYDKLIDSNKDFSELIQISQKNKLLNSNKLLRFIKNKYKESILTNKCYICTLAKYINYNIENCNYLEYKICAEEINNKYYKDIYNDMPYRVLVLDGGGILGYYQIKLLNELNISDKEIGDLFDLICATSTGSIIASGLAKHDISAEVIINLYKDKAKNIFPKPVPSNKLKKILWAIKHINKASGNKNELEAELEKIFNDYTLEELEKEKNIKLCISAVDLNNNISKLFKSYSEDTKKCKVKDVCLASSSAPIYFPSTKINDTFYTDGGLWANNPILISIIEALNIANPYQDIEIFRLPPPKVSNANILIKDNINQGLLYWQFGINIIDSSIEAQSNGFTKLANEYIRYLNKSSFRKINIYTFKSASLTKQDLESFKLDNSSTDNFKLMDQLIIRTLDYDLNKNIKYLFEK